MLSSVMCMPHLDVMSLCNNQPCQKGPHEMYDGKLLELIRIVTHYGDMSVQSCRFRRHVCIDTDALGHLV